MKEYTQDEFLLKSLEQIKKDLKENLDYAKNPQTDDEKEIYDDFKEILELLESLLPKIKDLDSLAKLKAEDIGFIFECLEAYEEVFIVSYLSEEEMEQTEYEHNLLLSILDLFED